MEWVQADPLQAADPAAWTVIHRDDPFDVREVFGHWLYPFAWENDWDHGGELTVWAREHMRLPVVLVVLYLGFIFGVRHFMRSREPFDLRRAQIVWNTMLSVFSFWGAFRTAPLLYALITSPPGGGDGFFKSYCGDPSFYGEKGAPALMMGLFIFSKVPELGDTVFIVLQKRKLLFLQWYHHITVLLYTGTRMRRGTVRVFGSFP